MWQDNLPLPSGAVEIPVKPGMKAWKNKNNGYTVIGIHYSADPDKDENWANEFSNGFPGGRLGVLWNEEMEMSSTASAEGLVYAEFDIGMVREEYKYNKTIYRGLDPSYRNFGCVWLQVTDYGGIEILGELLQHDVDVEIAVGAIQAYEHETFGIGRKIETIIDIAALDTSVTDGSSCMKQLHLLGIYPRGRKSKVVDGVSQVRSLMVTVEGKPFFTIHKSCGILIEGLTQGYRFDKEASDTPEKDDKHPWGHLLDCVRYVVVMLKLGRDVYKAKELIVNPPIISPPYWDGVKRGMR